MNRRLHELVALAALAALGCGLALAVGDFWFAAIFGIASEVKRPREIGMTSLVKKVRLNFVGAEH
jgi:hypothetical protein